MKKTSWALVATLLSFAAVSHAQSSLSPSTEIRESTDPARAAEVEQRAMEIQARQQSEQNMTSGSSEASDKPAKRAHGKKHSAKKGKSAAGDSTSGTSGDSGNAQSGSESSSK